MNIEKLLNAMLEAWDPKDLFGDGERNQQYNNYRAQILQMFAEMEGEIVILKEGAKYLKETRDKRDARIEHLENDLRMCVQKIDGHLKLLKANIEHHLMFGECLFCTMLELEEGHEHDPDCELEKELADA